jgi:hypothetical protein
MIQISHDYHFGSQGTEVLVVRRICDRRGFVFFSLSAFLKKGSSLQRLVLVAACSSLSGMSRADCGLES